MSVRKVDCVKHGVAEATFVCQHIVKSLATKKPVGFFWSAEDDSPHPDAWCSECEERVSKTGGEWIGEAEAQLEATLICETCYADAKRIAFADN